jgi:hypothetical protein
MRQAIPRRTFEVALVNGRPAMISSHAFSASGRENKRGFPMRLLRRSIVLPTVTGLFLATVSVACGSDSGGGTGGGSGTAGVGGTGGVVASGGSGGTGAADAGGPVFTEEVLFTADADHVGWSELALDATDVYVAAGETDSAGNQTDGHVYRVSKSGGGARIASNVGRIESMALTTQSAVLSVDVDPFRRYQGGKLLTVSKATGVVTELQTSDEARTVVADGGEAYWAAGFSSTGGLVWKIVKVSLSDGSMVEVSAEGGVALALDDTYVYWTDDNDGMQRRVRTLAAPAQLLGTSEYSISPKVWVPQAQALYWAIYGDGTLVRQRFTGEKATFLVGGPNQGAMVALGTALYWRNYDFTTGGPTTELGLERFDADAETVIPLGKPSIPVSEIAPETANVLYVTSGRPFKVVRLTSTASAGGAGGTGGSGGSGGPGATGGIGGSGGTGGTGGSCPAPPATCDVCQEQQYAGCACGSARLACQNDPACASIAQCVFQGVGGVGPCLDLSATGAACVIQCADMYPTGKAAYLAYEQCIFCDYCAAACAASEYCAALGAP